MNNLNLKDIKKGQTFYECERGKNLKMVALENAHYVRRGMSDGYTCKVEMEFGGKKTGLELYEAETPGAFGLNLYSEPQYK